MDTERRMHEEAGLSPTEKLVLAAKRGEVGRGTLAAIMLLGAPIPLLVVAVVGLVFDGLYGLLLALAVGVATIAAIGWCLKGALRVK